MIAFTCREPVSSTLDLPDYSYIRLGRYPRPVLSRHQLICPISSLCPRFNHISMHSRMSIITSVIIISEPQFPVTESNSPAFFEVPKKASSHAILAPVPSGHVLEIQPHPSKSALKTHIFRHYAKSRKLEHLNLL